MFDLNDNFNDWPLFLVDRNGRKEWQEASDEDLLAMQKANEHFFDIRFSSMPEYA